MIKHIFRFATMLFLFSCFALRAEAAANKKIIINDVDWPPYFFLENQSKYPGLGKEIINHCLSEYKYLADYRLLPIKRTHVFMETGAIDVTVYSYKTAREAFLVYGKEPLYSTEYGFMVRSDSKIKINSLADLEPLRIGHLAGLSYTPELLEIINQKIDAEQAVVANSMQSVFSQLLAKTPRIDIMANTKSTFHWQAKLLGVSDKIRVLEYKIKTKPYFMTVSKASSNIESAQDFLNEMDSCIVRLKQNGGYRKILSHYGDNSFK